MKKMNIIFLLLLCTGTGLFSQEQDPCGFGEAMESLLSTDPSYQSRLDSFEQLYAEGFQDRGFGAEQHYEIPLVFHILHNYGPENITGEQIYRAVEKLNHQFAGSEGGNNTRISFYIAGINPEGQCVEGINRVQTTRPGILSLDNASDAEMKDLSRWPTDRYVNVWVVRYIVQESPVTYTGYSYLPPLSNDRLDGVVVHYKHLGDTGAAAGNTTNTLTHEIGHYLGLLHVWGLDRIGPHQDWCEENCDTENCLTTGDRVCDTDPAYSTFYGSNNCSPLASFCEERCEDFPEGIYFYPKDNYMSYHHLCQDKFTAGQAERMRFTIGRYRASLPVSACSYACSVNILTDTVMDTPQTFNGNLYVKTGATLRVTTTLRFGQHTGIIVEDGGTLILESSAVLDKCRSEEKWEGVRVESGGAVVVRHAYVYHAERGIAAYSGSRADIDTVIITGLNNYSGTGIWLEGDVAVSRLRMVKVHNMRNGIVSWLGTGHVYHLDRGEIANTLYGVLMNGSSIVMNDYVITGTLNGVVLDGSAGSLITDNEIGASGTAITVNFSPFSYIGNNLIGWGSHRGHTGISLLRSGGTAISNHSQIRAMYYGIRSWQSDVLIHQNSIEISSDVHRFAGGIQLTDNHGSQVIDNDIDAGENAFGVETVMSTGTRIRGNRVSQFSIGVDRAAGIRSMGSTDEYIEDNTVNSIGHAMGILAQNSPFNRYGCNEISTTGEGLGIYYNSEMQRLRGNTLDAFTDLVIRSQIGLQIHHGNRFVGGRVRANELDPFEIQNSQFFVNGSHPGLSHLLPTDIVPSSDWFINDNNFNVFTCVTLPPQQEWLAFEGGEPGVLCRYYEQLLGLRTAEPEQFSVKLLHLLRYEKLHSDFSLPSCITADSTYLTLCGLGELSAAGAAFRKLNDATSLPSATLSDLQEEYLSETTENGREQVRQLLETAIATHAEDWIEKQEKHNLLLDSIHTVLSGITCWDSVVLHWKEVYLLYIGFLAQDSIAAADRPALEILSRACSDRYGDAVHLARAMAGTYSETYYDTYDGCVGSGSPPQKREEPQTGIVKVMPNPSTGIFQLSLPEGFEGELSVRELSGRILLHRKLTYGHDRDIDLSAWSGVLLLQFTDAAGMMTFHKVMVLR